MVYEFLQKKNNQKIDFFFIVVVVVVVEMINESMSVSQCFQFVYSISIINESVCVGVFGLLI